MSSIKDVLAPANEEGTRATILKWCKAVGDLVVKDEPLVELEKIGRASCRDRV